MSLKKGKLARSMKKFILEANELEVQDRDKAIDDYCSTIERVVYDAIKDLTIVIPTGSIVVSGTALTQSNLTPIVLEKVVK